MTKTWDQAAIQKYIDDEVEESLTLDYKAAASLAKSDGKKAEITKDVSAMANSAGGLIIYGLAEYQQPDKKHLPEKIDPVDNTQFTKEWLEQIINNIRPKIDNLVIHPVPITSSPNHFVYVVEIPQSTTAHQATDKRYYKRFNFVSEPMDDYEIRDVMGRTQHPVIKPSFGINILTENRYEQNSAWGYRSDFPNLGLQNTPEKKIYTSASLNIEVTNKGRVYAQYINAFFEVPIRILEYQRSGSGFTEPSYNKDHFPYNSTDYKTIQKNNTVRDVIDTELLTMGGAINKYGPARYDPILPGITLTWEISLSPFFELINVEGFSIKWAIYCDNAPLNSNEMLIKDILIVRKHSEIDR